MKAIVLFGHGSRDPAWRTPIDRVANRMLEMNASCIVRCAFLELTEPDLSTVTAELVSMGVKKITVIPMFLGVGRHAREDLPQLVRDLQLSLPLVDFNLRPPVGEIPHVIEMLAKLSLSEN